MFRVKAMGVNEFLQGALSSLAERKRSRRIFAFGFCIAGGKCEDYDSLRAALRRLLACTALRRQPSASFYFAQDDRVFTVFDFLANARETSTFPLRPSAANP